MEYRTVVPSGADSPYYSTVKDAASLAFSWLRWAPFEIFTRNRADLFNEFDAPLSRIPRVQSAAHSYELARKMKVYSMARDFFSDARNDLSSSFPLFEKRVD